jgi:hypothetical protein
MMSVTVPERSRQGAVDGEAVLDVDENEREDREVKGIHDPAEKDSPECSPLIRGHLPVPGVLRSIWIRLRIHAVS